jgi:hypothetical protein
LDALQTTFPDKNRMRRSAAGRVGAVAASEVVPVGIVNDAAREFQVQKAFPADQTREFLGVF